VLDVRHDFGIASIANESSFLFSARRESESATALLTLPGASVRSWTALTGTTLLAVAGRNPKAMIQDPPRDLVGIDRATVFIDFDARVVRPLASLPSRPDGALYPLLIAPGPFLEVTGAGDCLNVREGPARDATVIACYFDRVLLKDLGEEREADGVRWRHVETPLGAEGWAAMELLK
jgi:hypothetical protein